MKDILKARTIEHINFVEACSETLKKESEKINEIVKSIREEDDLETQKVYMKKYQAQYLYLSLMAKDLDAAIQSFIESYTCAKISGAKFSKEEDDIFDKYVESNQSAFVLVKGEVKPKDNNLKQILTDRFNTKDITEQSITNLLNYYKEEE